ncbi:hypothetical protein RIF29_11695 [Crotalaria pallida]|uniref:Uncharacterized protein n=1 Tax=Crotalaria pallida TaxID=3830 RepID=A0AAN9P1G5_CROPI
MVKLEDKIGISSKFPNPLYSSSHIFHATLFSLVLSILYPHPITPSPPSSSSSLFLLFQSKVSFSKLSPFFKITHLMQIF